MLTSNVLRTDVKKAMSYQIKYLIPKNRNGLQ